MSDVDPQMLKGLVTMLLLELLAARDDYGYALVVRLRDAGLAEISEGTIYPALARCETAGWVAAYYVPSERGPARKYYRLTDDGAAALLRAHESWDHLTALVARVAPKGDAR